MKPKSEHCIQNEGRNALVDHGMYFRANTGRGWTGNDVVKFPRNHPKYPGAVLIKDPRPFDTGLPKGFSDVFGGTPLVITQDMVGKTVLTFTAIEFKAVNGRITENQQNFLCAVRGRGGLAGVARSAEEAVGIVKGGL